MRTTDTTITNKAAAIDTAFALTANANESINDQGSLEITPSQKEARRTSAARRLGATLVASTLVGLAARRYGLVQVGSKKAGLQGDAVEAFSKESTFMGQDTASDLTLMAFETDANAYGLNDALEGIDGFRSISFGEGSKFEGYSSKWLAAASELSSLDKDAFVVISDNRDVILNVAGGVDAKGGIKRFKEAYEALTQDSPGSVVVSTESQCCVSALSYVNPGDYFEASSLSRKLEACSSGEDGCTEIDAKRQLAWKGFMQERAFELTNDSSLEDIYPNAGLVAGSAGNIVNLIQKLNLKASEDDQAVLTDLWYHDADAFHLDFYQTMFGSTRWAQGVENGCVFDTLVDGSLLHNTTKKAPLFIHSPGDFYECQDKLEKKLEAPVGGERRLQLERRKKIEKKRVGKKRSNYGKGSTSISHESKAKSLSSESKTHSPDSDSKSFDYPRGKGKGFGKGQVFGKGRAYDEGSSDTSFASKSSKGSDSRTRSGVKGKGKGHSKDSFDSPSRDNVFYHGSRGKGYETFATRKRPNIGKGKGKGGQERYDSSVDRKHNVFNHASSKDTKSTKSSSDSEKSQKKWGDWLQKESIQRLHKKLFYSRDRLPEKNNLRGQEKEYDAQRVRHKPMISFSSKTSKSSRG